jgi:uncharacterized protein (DUF934 family)
MRFIDPRKNPWQLVVGEDGPIAAPGPRAHALLSLEQWHAVRDHWPHSLKVGLLLANTVDVATLAADLPRVALVALQFPKWVDGRAYSQARLLRVRLRFAGELRATGEVLVDMLPLLARCGCCSVQLRPDQSVDAAERTLGLFAGHYQGSVDQPRPAFARNTALDLARAASRQREQAEQFAGEGI